MSDLSRKLRAQATEAEKLLWSRLRAKQIHNYRFRRQYPIGNYVVDFVCLPQRLIIEVDGGQHVSQNKRDEARSNWLRSQNFTIIRFWNNEVLENIEGVLLRIMELTPPPPDLLPQGEEEK